MNLGPVTKLEKGNKITPKKFDNDVMSEYCDVIDFFPIYGHFGTICKLDSRRIVVKLIFSLIVAFYVTETENRTKNSLTQPSHYCFE